MSTFAEDFNAEAKTVVVPTGVHFTHYWVRASKGDVFNAVHFAAYQAASRGGTYLEPDGMLLPSRSGRVKRKEKKSTPAKGCVHYPTGVPPF
eukprot:1138816-Pelagomonas_calceolata.AAC.3